MNKNLGASISQVFEQQVLRSPHSIAVTFAGHQLTYSELNARANQLAYYLQDRGIEPQTRIGICVERSLEMVIGLLGILKAGATYVPLDPAHPVERTRLVLEDAEVSCILTQKHLIDSLPLDQTQVICLDVNDSKLAQYSEDNLGLANAADDIAYLIYTSGSTGKPKGVPIAHQGVINLLKSFTRILGISSQDQFVTVASICFDMSVADIFLPLMVGAGVIIASTAVITDGVQLAQLLQTSGATVMAATPSTWQLLLQSGWKGNPLLKIHCAGEALSRKLANQLLKRGASVWNLYGPTEATIWTTSAQVEPGTDSIPIGRPILNTEIYVLDEQLNPVADGEVGELYIGGVGLAVGYLNRPQLTAERFIPNPFDPEGQTRLYKTGDLVRLRPDGQLDYLGRIDHQVKIRGFRIELGEIEAVLNQLPTVQETVVVAREDRPGDKQLAAYLIPCPQESPQNYPTPIDLRNWLVQQLPHYMIPAAFMYLEAFPLNSNGKVDRKALPVPDVCHFPLQSNWVAPQTAIEKTLAEIWSAVLGIEKVGIEDHWLDLGGHSLLATQIISQIRTTYGINLSLRCLFEAPTIATLAQQIETQLTQSQSTVIPPIQPLPQRHNLPLSFAQARLWFLDRLEPNQIRYNVPAAVRLTGALNLQRLSASLNQIIQRHEVLRTTFTTINGEPQQVIQPVAELALSVINLETLPPADRETAAQQILLKETQQPFDLSAESLFRVTLIQLDADDAILLMVVHHILCDDWSMNLLFQELSLLYNHHNAATALPELTLQYGDFAVWQRQWLQGEVLDHQLNYWRQQMADLPKLQLPTDHPRPTHNSDRGARQSFQLSQPLTTALMALSRQEGVTLFMTLLAVFQVLLYRYTGQEDVAVATPVANRHHPGIESLIGFFVNIVMLRTNLSGAPSFRELLQRVRRMALDAYSHQDLPFEKLVEALHPQRSLNGQPLFDVVFALQNRHFSQPLQLDGLQHQWIEIDNGTAKCDLLLQLIETPEGLTGYFEYCTDLFEAETISRMVGHFQTLLTAIVADANQPITQLSMLTPPELHQLLVTWNNTQTDYPQDRCVHQLFEAQVQHQPDAVAVVFGEEQLTYGQLNRRANQLADYLQSLGVTPEGLVGLCVERSLDMVVGLLAILKAGGAYLPLDPEYPTERLQYMLQDAQVQVLLTQQHLVERLSDYQGQSICLDTDWSVISQCSPENPITAVETSHLAYVIYTSGSTGQPKGVMVSHQALLNLVFWHQQAFEVTAQDKATQLAGTAFDAAGWELWPYLSIGASIDLVPSDIRISPENLQAWLTSQDITISFLPTPVAEQFLSLEWTETTPLRTVLTGGDRLHQYPSRSVPFQVVNNYGPTENTVVTTSGLVAPHQQTNQIPPSIGHPIANIQTYILDSHLQPVPIGVPGELYIGGAGLAQGYLNRPDLTQEKFISNPFNPSKLYKTGDLVRYLPDGNIEFIGRIDNQVKIRGFRIELGEIETVLGQHRGIQAFCVIVREDTPGNKRLVAYIVPKPQMIPSISQLRQFLKAQLPDYMVPSAFVVLESLPLTPNGKVDHRALPAPDFSAHGDHYIAPSTITEAILAQIWSQVLTVKKVGIHNNFFELGGNSLLAARAIAQMQDILEVNIPVRYLFEFPTIAQLAEQLDNTQTVETKPATINLNADIVLPLETCPQSIVAPETLSQPNYIFLTGSTGFLGAFLIDELLRKTPATLYCLVRAVDTQQGMKKLQQTLEKYRLWQPGFSHRIIPVAGDLEKPLLGLTVDQFNQLAAQIDTIYHSGAQVNFVKPYSVVKVANVLGTQEVIKLAVQSQIKPLHYISTAGVFGPVSYFEDCPILFENEDIGDYEEYVALDLGYSQSKWVAEKLVKIAQSRGLPVTIMRPGFILGHPETGVTHTTDFWSRFIKGCLEMGYFPELVNQAQEFIPINYVSEAIVYLSMQSDSIGKVFHLTPPEQHLTTIELFELIQSLGYPLQSLPYSQWKKRLIQQTKQSPNHALAPLLPIFTEAVYKDLTIMELYQKNPKYDCQNTIAGLKGTSIQCPKIDQALVKTYLSYFMEIGFIEPPITAQVGSI